MFMDPNNKVVIVTGGAEGIGFKIADQFLQNGAKTVIILDINEDKGKQAVETLTTQYGINKAEFFKCDVTKDLEEISRSVIDKYNIIDVLVNSAGVLDEFNLRRTMKINAIATMEWTMKLWEHMRTDQGGKGGTIINISSIYGYRIDHFLPFYKASKFAVTGFTKTFGHQCNYKRYGVRIVAVCPGFTKSNLTENFKIPDARTQGDLKEFVKGQLWQETDAVGSAAIEVFRKADSGTAWVIEGGMPIQQI